MLRLFPKRGALVVPVSPSEVTAVMETRVLVESFAIERAARDHRDLVEALMAAIGQQEHFLRNGDTRTFVEADREFHRLFVEAAGNPILLGLYDSLRDRQARMGLTAAARGEDRLPQIIDEHRTIATAVGAGDVEAARAALQGHLAEQLDRLRAA